MYTDDNFHYLIINPDSSAIIYKEESQAFEHFLKKAPPSAKKNICFKIDEKHEFLLKMVNYFLSGESLEKKIKNYYSDVQTEDYPLSEATIEIQNIIKLMKNLHLYFSLDDDLDIIEKHIEQPLCNYYFRQLVPKFQEYYDALKSRGQIDVSKTHLHFDKKKYRKATTFREKCNNDYNTQYKKAYSYTIENFKQMFESENKIYTNLFLPIHNITGSLDIFPITNFPKNPCSKMLNDIFDEWFQRHFDHPDCSISFPPPNIPSTTCPKNIILEHIYWLNKYLKDYMNFVSNPSNPHLMKLDFSSRFNYFYMLNYTNLTNQMKNFIQIPDIILKARIVVNNYLETFPQTIFAGFDLLMQREYDTYNETFDPEDQDELLRLQESLTIENPFSNTSVMKFDSLIQLIIWELSVLAKKNIILRRCMCCNIAFFTTDNKKQYCENCRKNKYLPQMMYQEKTKSDDGDHEYKKIKNRISTQIYRSKKEGNETKTAKLEKQLEEWKNETAPYKEQYKQKNLQTDKYKELLNASYTKIFKMSSTRRSSS